MNNFAGDNPLILIHNLPGYKNIKGNQNLNLEMLKDLNAGFDPLSIISIFLTNTHFRDWGNLGPKGPKTPHFRRRIFKKIKVYEGKLVLFGVSEKIWPNCDQHGDFELVYILK